MSLRALKRYLAGNNATAENNDSQPSTSVEDEFDVPCMRTLHQFEGLDISSNSESGHEFNETETEEEEKPKEKQKKRNKNGRRKKSNPMDEIEKSIKAVNAILGNPPEPKTSYEHELNPDDELLSINRKHLDVNNELRKLFGPDEDEGKFKRAPRGRRPLRKPLISPVGEFKKNYKRDGLTMSIERRENGITYFRFEHDERYQRRVREFMKNVKRFRNQNPTVLPSDEKMDYNMHMEIILEYATKCFIAEKYNLAYGFIEDVVSYMQCMAHPLFKLTDRTVRLEYKYAENRPFHVALLKFLFLHTNKACHRTALEIAKVLMNIDPSDPLAVILIIDTLALRARQHQWLIDFVRIDQRDILKLYNIQYSHAMAHFHVATKNKESTAHADELLQNAMLCFPLVITQLYKLSNFELPTNRLFRSLAELTTYSHLKRLLFLYVKLTYDKWREPDVVIWLKRNVNTLAEKYDNMIEVRELAKTKSRERKAIYGGWPTEVIRHMTVIRDMSQLIVEGAVPKVDFQLAANPEPPDDGVDRYEYYQPRPPRPNQQAFSWFRTVLP